MKIVGFGDIEFEGEKRVEVKCLVEEEDGVEKTTIEFHPQTAKDLYEILHEKYGGEDDDG